MTIKLSLKGGGSLPILAASNFTNRASSSVNYDQVTGIDGSSGLTTALSLTGKFAVSSLAFESMINELVTVKLTIDGVVIYNDSQTVTSTVFSVVGVRLSSSFPTEGSYLVNSSLLLEISTATDTSVILNYIARPIA
jgi:hypothetical protein